MRSHLPRPSNRTTPSAIAASCRRLRPRALIFPCSPSRVINTDTMETAQPCYVGCEPLTQSFIHMVNPIVRSQMDEVNVRAAAHEASIRNDDLAVCIHLQPAENYALDGIASALHAHGGLSLGKITLQSDGSPLPGTYLVGDGRHWKVLFARANGEWGRCDGPAFLCCIAPTCLVNTWSKV